MNAGCVSRGPYRLAEVTPRSPRSTFVRRAALVLAALAVAISALAGRADAFIYWANSTGGAQGTGTIGRANLDGTGVDQGFIGASNPKASR